MQFDTPRENLVFNIAQTFLLDKDFFKGAEEVGLTKVNLYFKKKPTQTNNQSGILSPGVNIYLCATTQGDIPDLTKLLVQGFARVEWNEIVPSTDASQATAFNFPEPIEVNTGFVYAVLIQFDGDEDFELWTSKEGQTLVGSNTKTAGPAGQYIGKYFEYNSSVTNAVFASRLKALNDTDLKFDVYCAKYAGFSNSTVTNTVTSQTATIQTANLTMSAPSDRYEFFIYEGINSQNVARIEGGDFIFQNTVFVPGTVSINANSTVVTGGGGVNFNTLYDLTSGVDQYLIVYVNDDPEKYMVRRIQSIVSNTQLSLELPSRHTNAAASFMRSPVGIMHMKDRSKSFGKKKDLLILKQSNANSSLRFTNNCVESVTINSGGSSYVNGDILTIVAVGTNTINATANLTTNSTGGITSLTFSNIGAGINSAPSYTFANSTGGASLGSSANLSFGIGMTLLSSAKDTKFANATLINYDFHGSRWAGNVGKNKGTKHQVKANWKYYSTGNTYNINVHANKNSKLLNKLQRHNLPTKQAPLAVSWSYRVLQGDTSNTDFDDVVVDIIVESNSWFTVPKVNNPNLYIYKNIINNDYTNEDTRYGNALSKHVSTKINFDDGRFAEDLIVYLRAHRPANTDIKVFAKIHNSNDPEAFDDKSWTLLNCTGGANVYSSDTNEDDLREYTYGFTLHPNTATVDAGTVETTLNSETITGYGTTFNTTFAANDMIKIWSPLFPTNYMVSIVNNVASDTSLTIKHPVSNNGVVGTGLKVEKLDFKNQAFSYGLNDGIVRYYSSTLGEYDTYDTFALKIVLLASDPGIAPSVDDCRAVGVSA
jgi:hypothetical protein